MLYLFAQVADQAAKTVNKAAEKVAEAAPAVAEKAAEVAKDAGQAAQAVGEKAAEAAAAYSGGPGMCTNCTYLPTPMPMALPDGFERGPPAA